MIEAYVSMMWCSLQLEMPGVGWIGECRNCTNKRQSLWQIIAHPAFELFYPFRLRIAWSKIKFHDPILYSG